LFLGIELEDAVTAAAAGVARDLQSRLSIAAPDFDARWVPRANLHITLWFLGELAEPQADGLIARLREPFNVAPFQLRLDGCGVFPNSGAPRAIWIAIAAGTDPMRALHARTADRLAPLGFLPERRPYSPHLTIARVKEAGRGTLRGVRDAIAATGADCGISAVRAVTLFRSRLSPHGAAYGALLRVPLT
jgi:2'-5' RNA ligase